MILGRRSDHPIDGAWVLGRSSVVSGPFRLFSQVAALFLQVLQTGPAMNGKCFTSNQYGRGDLQLESKGDRGCSRIRSLGSIQLRREWGVGEPFRCPLFGGPVGRIPISSG